VRATAGKPGRGWRVLDPQLHVVHDVPVPQQADEERTGQHLTVDRLTLRRIMLTGIDLRPGSAFRSYELLDDSRVRAHFADGTTTDADLLAAADGTHSRVRAQLLPHAEVRETGLALVFGPTPLTDEVRAPVPVPLVGDAIHTMIPRGTSAATALRDAALLCRRITERSGPLLSAVREYETEMLEYGFAEVERSLRASG
jgi:2-polyprenyl-6-methoxyphenol hydroxylase-like FAD-dependent oxidoreductase